jgi:hypothetical protein
MFGACVRLDEARSPDSADRQPTDPARWRTRELEGVELHLLPDVAALTDLAGD